MIREAGQWKRGYLKLKIWGYGVERFLNVCGKTGIDIWGVRAERTSCDPVCFCCMELKDFHRIRPIVRKTKVHIRIQKRLGLPFPSQEPETMDFICGPLTDRNDFDGIIHVFMESDL